MCGGLDGRVRLVIHYVGGGGTGVATVDFPDASVVSTWADWMLDSVVVVCSSVVVGVLAPFRELDGKWLSIKCGPSDVISDFG